MPPIEWPTSTTGPVGAVASQDGEQVVAELVDRGVLVASPARAAVAALVPEDQPAQVGEVAALVVPAVLVQRQPVAERSR